jgi:hypothetical protein
MVNPKSNAHPESNRCAAADEDPDGVKVVVPGGKCDSVDIGDKESILSLFASPQVLTIAGTFRDCTFQGCESESDGGAFCANELKSVVMKEIQKTECLALNRMFYFLSGDFDRAS